MRQHEEERKVTWTELFFDLVFVAAAHQMATTLKYQETFWNSVPFLLLLLPILWVWVGHTMFTNRLGDYGKTYHFFTMGMMVGVLGLVVTLPQAFGDYLSGFAISYAFARFCLVALFMRSMLRNKTIHHMLLNINIGFTISAVLWFISAFVPPVFAYSIWVIAFAIDILAPIRSHKKLGSFTVHATHLPERLGLLTVIMLGEMIISTTATTFDIPLTIDLLSLLIAGLLMIAALANIYFKFSDQCISGRIKGSGQLFLYSHLPMFIGLVCLATGYKGIIAYKETTWLIMLGMVLFILSFRGIKYVAEQRISTRQIILFFGFFPLLVMHQFYTPSLYFNTILISGIFVIYVIISDWISIKPTQELRKSDIFG